MRRTIRQWLPSLLIAFTSTSMAADKLDKSLTEATRMHQEGKHSQQVIDKARDATDQLQQEFRQLSSSLAQVNINYQHSQQVRRQQQASIDSLTQQLAEVDKTESAIIPTLFSMIDWLELQLANDLPFLQEERQARLDTLKKNMIDPTLSLTERYRQVLDTYQTESEYGYTIEATKTEIQWKQQTRQVNVLRIGRIGLYFESLDGQSAGHWDQATKTWQPVDKDTLSQIHQGILIAKKQRPHTLLALPVQVTQ